MEGQDASAGAGRVFVEESASLVARLLCVSNELGNLHGVTTSQSNTLLHLWQTAETLRAFNTESDQLLRSVGDAYSAHCTELVELRKAPRWA